MFYPIYVKQVFLVNICRLFVTALMSYYGIHVHPGRIESWTVFGQTKTRTKFPKHENDEIFQIPLVTIFGCNDIIFKVPWISLQAEVTVH